jgi:hypothetical protein
MRAIKTVLIAGLITLAPFAAKAEEVVLAWQAPGYVIEEIVSVASRPATPPRELREPAARPQIPDSCM